MSAIDVHLPYHFATLNVRNKPSIDEDARLESGGVVMLAEALGETADLWVGPAVKRDCERCSRREAWDEAGQGWQSC